MSKFTESLVEWALDFEMKGSPDLEDVVRLRLLDYVTNLLGGLSSPSAKALGSVLPKMSDNYGIGRASWLAISYGAAAHALELDDTHQPSSTHPGAVMFSALVPLAAESEVDFSAFAAAAVKGYEIMGRIAAASGPKDEYQRGFHPTGTAGVFGAAAAASSLLRSNSEEFWNSLGIAASFSSGSMSFLTNGSWTKHLHPGWAAHSGITAAVIAAADYVGPREFLEGPHGYFAGHSTSPTTSRLADDLGSAPLVIARTSIKAHGCCRYEQAAIDAILHLRAAERIEPADVEEIRVGVLSAGWDIIAHPLTAKRRPANVVDAQFSMPFGAAVAMLHGRASPYEHSAANIDDDSVKALMDKVVCYRSPQLDQVFPAKWPASVEIKLGGGNIKSWSVEHPKGDPENPFSEDELRQRFVEVCPYVPEGIASSLLAEISSLRSGQTMSGFTSALAETIEVVRTLTLGGKSNG